MRISDWSSDVCSSDLQRPVTAARFMPVGGGAVMVVAMRVAGGRELSGDRRVDRRGLAIATELRIGQAVARLAVVGIDDVTARAARMAIVAEIGRASWRERVCTYV